MKLVLLHLDQRGQRGPLSGLSQCIFFSDLSADFFFSMCNNQRVKKSIIISLHCQKKKEYAKLSKSGCKFYAEIEIPGAKKGSRDVCCSH